MSGGMRAWERDLGIRLQTLDDVPGVRHAYRAARWLVSGSLPGPNWRPRWQRVRTVIPFGSKAGGVTIDRDDTAGHFPRTYRHAAVLGIGGRALSNILTYEGYEGVPAVFLHEFGSDYAAPLTRPLGLVDMSDAETSVALHAAAVRQDGKVRLGGIGVLYPAHETLFIPEGITVIEQHVPVRNMASRYPGVPLA